MSNVKLCTTLERSLVLGKLSQTPDKMDFFHHKIHLYLLQEYC